MNEFYNKYGPWALITGGTSGIGLEIANQVAEKGLNIILVSRRKEALQETAEKLISRYGVKVKVLSADLSKPGEYKKLIEAVSDLEVGLFVPCAGTGNFGRMSKSDRERELAVIELNVTSVFALTHYFAGEMEKRGNGGILFVSSLVGHVPNAYFSNYSGTKGYINNFANSINWELKQKGVDVTVLSPGFTDTPASAKAGKDVDFSKLPFNLMSPKDVVKAGLDALGNKAVIIPGLKNKIMVFMTTRLTPIATAIAMGGKMMDKAVPAKMRD